MNDLSEKFRTGGLSETPWWRWVLYAILFCVVVGILGIKDDIRLLYYTPIAATFIVFTFWGMSKIIRNPKSRDWILRKLGILITIFVVLRIALFIWDKVADK